MSAASRFEGRYPGRAPIEAYGNGGFRFAGMSHKGSLLCLPDRMEAWDAADPAALSVASLEAVLAMPQAIGFLLLGTGVGQVFPVPDLRRAFAEAGIGLEPMSTGAACRTYNVMLAEGRPVAAALIAVP